MSYPQQYPQPPYPPGYNPACQNQPQGPLLQPGIPGGPGGPGAYGPSGGGAGGFHPQPGPPSGPGAYGASGGGGGYGGEWGVAPHVTKHELKKHRDNIFYKYDRDSSGYLNCKELYFALCELFAMMNCPPPPEAYVWQLLKEYDKNGDERISHKEFKKFTKHLCKFEVKKKYI